MPQGIAPTAPIHFNRHIHVAPEPGVPARIRLSTRLHRARLDEQIACGAGVEGDERLALRAEQLTSRDERDRVARGLERTLEAADHAAEARRARGARVLSLRVPLCVPEIRDCAADFDALLARLRDEDAIDARGVAMTKRLLSNGASPLYYRRSPFTLRHAVRSARLGLEPVAAPVEVEVPVAA
jgi:hypothetical protein